MALELDDLAAVPVSSELYGELVRRFPRGVSSVVEDVVWDFLNRTEEDFRARQGAPRNGIHWDKTFLPSGTKLRTRYLGEFKYAEVSEDKIQFGGDAVPSVSQLARRMRGNTSVNAWLCMEVMRPTDSEWQKANSLRSQ